jgi:hypothetical protein
MIEKMDVTWMVDDFKICGSITNINFRVCIWKHQETWYSIGILPTNCGKE